MVLRLGLLLLILPVFAHAEVMVRVRPHVVAQPGSDVKLIQLIDAQGLSAASEAQMQTTTLTKAPDFGARQELAQASIMEVLRPIIQTERAASGGTVHLMVPKAIVIDTMKRAITSEQVEAELKQVWQPLCPECKLDIENLSLPAIQGVRDWTLKLKRELPRGSFSVPVSIVRDDMAPLTAWINGRVSVKRKVPVLKRAMAAGERVQPVDFEWEYKDTSFSFDGVPGPDDMVGRRVRQALRAGDTLWLGLLEKEKAIRRGEAVQIKSGEGLWEVSMTVVAQQDAVIGDVINLKNPKTNNILTGQVTGFGEVELR